MLVKEWMASDLITVSPDTRLMRALQIMKKNNIRRLPVVDQQGHLVGIITDRDLKAAGPSKVTTLDVHEQFYLFGELTAADIMTPDPVTLAPSDTVEKAAAIMLARKISGLPVVDKGLPVGIITLDDVARVLTEITGVFRGGIQLSLSLPQRPGSIMEVSELIRNQGGEVVSILSIRGLRGDSAQKVYMRLAGEDLAGLEPVLGLLEERGQLIYATSERIDGEDMPRTSAAPGNVA